MPHSSGGGSHGGGFHGGSFHAGRFGSGNMNMNHGISYSHYHNAGRYVFYTRNKPVYFYADSQSIGDLTERNFKKNCRLTVAIVVVSFVFLSLISGSFNYAVPLDVPPKEIFIEDTADVLGDVTVLRDKLEDFRDATGITPEILTVHNEEWENKEALSSYAYDYYCFFFKDETRWLIVYSEPENPNPDFVEWAWEGMQGNDTDKILTEDVVYKFDERFHNNLEVNNMSVNDALTDSFSFITDVTRERMGFTVKLVNLFFVTGFVFYELLVCIALFRLTPTGWKMCKAVACKKDTKECVCRYCGKTYLEGTCTRCPYCNAAIEKD